ncbi:hypothetical protein B0H14DRAFT_2575214 [Mycena olivaceomarginata]|nr:hypothetical protein B0H14DRAFT_2575214 [Mycena olivaceomarginata]
MSRKSEGLEFKPHPYHLPNLIKFSAPGSLVPSLICDTKSIQTICIYWCSGDIDMETPLTTLGRMVSPNIHGLIATSDDIHELSSDTSLRACHTFHFWFSRESLLSPAASAFRSFAGVLVKMYISEYSIQYRYRTM